MKKLLFLISPEDYMLPCLNKKLLGFECFGCGIQRSVVFLFQGEFIAAFKIYPAIYTLIPLFVLFIAKFFFKIKYVNKIISILAILSLIIIITNFTIKLIR